MTPQGSSKDRWLVGGIFGGIGLIVVAVGWALVLIQARTLSRAVATPGEVLEAYVETATSVKGPDSHVARVRYRYLVRDTLWENDRVLPHDIRTSSRTQMRTLAQRFPVGSAITVWVDPDDPERAFLLKELLWLPYVFALAPMLFVLIGAMVALPPAGVSALTLALLAPLWWHQCGLPEPIPGWFLTCYVALMLVSLLPLAWRFRRRVPPAMALLLTLGACSGGSESTVTAPPPAASIAACKLPRASGSVNFGFPRSADRLKAVGDVRISVIFVDFPDAAATRTPESVFAGISPGAEERFRAFSYGRMNVTMAPNLRWFRMSKASTQYGYSDGLSFAEHRALMAEALALADPTTDFSTTDALVVITNPDATGIRYGPAYIADGSGEALRADGRNIYNGTNSGADMIGWGGANWVLHELGHTLSLPDLYDYTPGTLSQHQHVGEWSQMGLISGRAPEWSGFERWQLGWLDDSQVLCAQADTTAPLTPLAGTGTQKLILVPIGARQAIAVESRRALGYDSRIPRPGLLVYLVNTAVASGEGTMRVLPEENGDAVKLNRTLTVGQSLTYNGVTIRYVSSVGEVETVQVDR